ncbi:MAG: DUF1460 domain-containing protein [Saprospiraceae bacterium]|nr:DUF1460 domain-containing protein [Saprospiraceae bacterium]MCC6411754.1 DUF1460 domain-containing protein [Saprospiraceae bacterium]
MLRHLFCLLAVFFGTAFQQQSPGIDPRDATLFASKVAIAAAETSLAARTLAVAESFLGAPYVSGTLDVNTSEKLVVNLRQLDCWTLVENSLAIALTSQETPPGLTSYENYLRQLRYWGGTINGYGSRIHYFTGWTLQAEKLGYVTDITEQLGGRRYDKHIAYMSARPHKYPALNNPKNLQDIQNAETRINRHAWHYIPENRIEMVEDKLKPGDIILLTSAKRDLDIAHQGFAVVRNGRIHLLHASSLSKRVMVSSQPLGAYVRSQVGQTGIMVLRVVG